MQYIKDFFTNYMLVSVIAAWFTAQVLKGVTGIFKLKKFTVTEFLFGTGGMPSSHTAAVVALTTSSVIAFGFKSAVFAVSALLAMIVIRDAMGIRHEVGNHARELNRIIQKSLDAETTHETLKELVGHTPLQVLMGAVVGVAVAVIMSLFDVFSTTL